MEEKELEQYCRRLAHVPYQDVPYHDELAKVKSVLTQLEQSYFSSAQEEGIRKIRDGLSALADPSSLREKVSSFFAGETGRLEALGESLAAKKEDIKSFRGALREKFNYESQALHTLSLTVQALIMLKEDYCSEKEIRKEELASFSQQSEEERSRQVEELLEEKLKESGKEYSYAERQQIRINLQELGRKHLSKTATSYLQLVHDISLIEGLVVSYSPLTVHSEETVLLLNELVKYTEQQAAAVEGVLNAYLGITRKELFYTLQGSLPSGLVEKVNELTGRIQEADKRTGQKVLERLFERGPRIRALSLNGVVPGVVKKLTEGEK